jgi:hypothetical protein
VAFSVVVRSSSAGSFSGTENVTVIWPFAAVAKDAALGRTDA